MKRGVCIRKRVDSVRTFEVYASFAVIDESAEQSGLEKNEWFHRYIPEIDKVHRIFTVCGTNRADAMGDLTRHDVLLDDDILILNAWVKGGQGAQ